MDQHSQVLSYDERRGQFEIMFLPRADPKHVCRFNLLFDNEDKAVRHMPCNDAATLTHLFVS